MPQSKMSVRNKPGLLKNSATLPKFGFASTNAVRDVEILVILEADDSRRLQRLHERGERLLQVFDGGQGEDVLACFGEERRRVDASRRRGRIATAL